MNIRIESVIVPAGGRLVHLVATFGRAQMRQAGAGEMQMRAVGMIDRRAARAAVQRLRQIDALIRQLRAATMLRA